MKTDWIGDPLMFGAAAATAFLVAGVVVAIDCWRQNSAEFMYSTYPVLRDPIGVLFCVILGLISTITFAFAQYAPDSWFGNMVTLKTDNMLARGALVGGSVMIIVRSKLLQLGSGGGDLGLEFFYLRGREAVLRRLRRRQANEKTRLIRDYLETIMQSSDFPAELDLHVRELLQGEVGRLQAYIKQRDGTANPNKAFAADDPLWITFYKMQMRNAVDFVGIGAMRGWLDSQ